MRFLILACCCVVWLVCGGNIAAASDRLVFSTGMVDPWTNGAGNGFHQRLIAELLARLSLTGDVDVNLAASRAIHLANDGVTDGLAGRVAGVEKEHTNLIPVPEPMFYNDFVAASLRPATPLPNWQALRPYNVGYIIGWQVFERNLPPEQTVTLAKESSQLLSLLQTQRVDVVLHERWQLLWQAKALGMTVNVAEPPLARVPMYIYLHQRHAHLVKPMADALRQMKADGSYERIASTVFAGLGASVSGLK